MLRGRERERERGERREGIIIMFIYPVLVKDRILITFAKLNTQLTRLGSIITDDRIRWHMPTSCLMLSTCKPRHNKKAKLFKEANNENKTFKCTCTQPQSQYPLAPLPLHMRNTCILRIKIFIIIINI